MIKKQAKQKNCSDYFVIPKNSTAKGFFDISMLLVSCYNIFGNAYFATFGERQEKWIIIINFIAEMMFLFDMIFNFLQEYLDDETYIIISDLKLISKRYLRGNFTFDLLAWIPFDIILSSNPHRLYRLLKLLRIPRLAQLINVEQAKLIVNDVFQKRLLRDIQNEKQVDMEVINQRHYPIKLALQLIKAYEIVALVIIIFSTSFFFGILWHIFVHDFENWKTRTSYDIFNGYLTFYTYSDYDLIWTEY